MSADSKLELVKSRRSVRTFDGKAMDEKLAADILACAEASANPYGLEIEWKLLDAQKDGLKSPVISGTDCYIAGKMKMTPYAEEAFGYSFENVVMYAAELGIGTTWIGGTMDRAAFEKAIDLKDGEVMPCVSPLGRPAGKMGIKEIMMRKGVKADVRLDFGELFFKGDFGTPLTESDAGELKPVLEMVRWAPSAVNKQPWRLVVDGNRVHFYEKHNNGFVNKAGWDMQKIDMGIALHHFDMGMKEQQRDIKFVIDKPSIATPSNVDYIATYIL